MTLKIDFPQSMIPDNIQELVDRLESTDNREVGRNANKEIDKNEFSPGLINAAKKAIQERNRLNQSPGMSASEAREDRILRTRDSSGKATARKF